MNGPAHDGDCWGFEDGARAPGAAGRGLFAPDFMTPEALEADLDEALLRTGDDWDGQEVLALLDAWVEAR